METLITIEEQKAIRSLQRLANKFPQSLMLFSMSGSLEVLKIDETIDEPILLQTIVGIKNDGGDPTAEADYYTDESVEIEYE